MILLIMLYARVGLSTQFGEIYMQIGAGVKYSFRQLKGQYFSVLNTGDAPTDIIMSVEKPLDSECLSGYEPIPDINFIKILKSQFKNVLPGMEAATDILVEIPDKYENKKFQAFIWSRTVGERGFSIGAGLRSRVLIEAVKVSDKTPGIRFELLPYSLFVEGLDAYLTVYNYADSKAVFELKKVDGFIGHNEIKGAPEWLKLSSRIYVKKKGIKNIKLKFKIPGEVKGNVVFYIECKPVNELSGVVSKVVVRR